MIKQKRYLLLGQDLLISLTSGNSAQFFLRRIVSSLNVSADIRLLASKLISDPLVQFEGELKSNFEYQFWFLLQKSINGASIYEELQDFLNSQTVEIENLYERKLALMPIIMSMFLVFFIFPAYMVLLLGPILSGIQF